MRFEGYDWIEVISMESVPVTLPLPQPELIAQYMTTGALTDTDLPAFQAPTLCLTMQPLDLGVCQIDQWWIERSQLYPTRQRAARMYTPIVDAFWQLCRAESTDDDPQIRESYLLAKLLPQIRDQGARDVFRDSVIHRRSSHRAKREDADQLEALLSRSFEPKSVEAFHRLTADLLGPPDYTAEDMEHYYNMVEHLLAPGRALLSLAQPEVALAETERRWQSWMSQISRRSGKEDEKRVLDVLSYECKAAFHQAYSAVWTELINVLERQHGLTPRGARFHRWWQRVHTQTSYECPELNAYLFHGHIFGLHTASGTFIDTAVGKRLIGNWLMADSQETFEQLLGGLAVAVTQYYSVYDQQRLNRRR